MRRFLSALILLVPLLAPAAQAAEGPAVTISRQLDLATSHLQSVAAAAGEPAAEQAMAEELAAAARGLHFELESAAGRPFTVANHWDHLLRAFYAARPAFATSDSAELRQSMQVVHSLMNRLDRRLGGSGFWNGRYGWAG